MGRLIDGTIQALPLTNYILERKEAFIKALEKGDNDFLFAMMMDYFDEQPTAYDTEAVVKTIEDVGADNLCTLVFQDDCNTTMDCSECRTKTLVEIIRKGGIDG